MIEVRIEIIRFALSGLVGFLADAGVVAVGTTILALSPIPAQLIAFSVAVTVTWVINRNWTFAEHASDRWIHEWSRYVAINSAGAVVNNGVYVLSVLGITAFFRGPVLAVAVGSLAGMAFNFAASNRLVFRDTTGQQ